jgi:glycogen operon protein
MAMLFQPGQPYPLGANIREGGVNFSIFSKNSTALELLLFDDVDDERLARVIPLDPHHNRTFYYWHILVPGIGAGQLYGYRAYGPNAPERGLRFDSGKVLLDPYARAVVCGKNYSREAAKRPGDNTAFAPKSVVTDPRAYRWEGDKPLRVPYAGSAIYELHVGGFTRHPNSGVAAEKRGTYLGLIEKIPYLKELGVTAVELLPVQQFDEQDAPRGQTNFWGYSPLALFAPHRGYSARPDPCGPVFEFCDMVKALHRAGLEVILDVVFNHTAEGGADGPTLSFRGLENRAYYLLDRHDRARYADYSGCGNTLNANHSVVRRMILDCLRHWVQVMHVDGFRFDLASVLSRDEHGRPLENPPILWEIESDPVLAGTKIIAEAWDAAGLYQVGSFIGHRWAEWNGKYRDDVRRFVKGDAGLVSALASRLTGSRDVYRQPDREPNRSINFVTCHDGFTLNDLVSYDVKHNESNGENNRDGSDANFSWNCGAEGLTADPAIEQLRVRQMKNLLTILFVSQGTPMMLMGDEMRRSQQGNNNAYCQDNAISWFDWSAVEHQAGFRRFVRLLILFSQSHDLFQQERFWNACEPSPPRAEGAEEGPPCVAWHGVHLHQPDWGHDSHSLALELNDPEKNEHLYIALNAYWEALEFALPPLPARRHWRRVVDTHLPPPDDIAEPGAEVRVTTEKYRVEARAAIVLKAG